MVSLFEILSTTVRAGFLFSEESTDPSRPHTSSQPLVALPLLILTHGFATHVLFDVAMFLSNFVLCGFLQRGKAARQGR